MTKQEKNPVAAPVVKEALGGVLNVSSLVGGATAQIHATPPVFSKDSEVELITTTSTGNSWNVSVKLTNVPFILNVLVPKEVFEKNLVPGATATLQYTIKTNGSSVASERLELTLEK
jgi:hypothetical protein